MAPGIKCDNRIRDNGEPVYEIRMRRQDAETGAYGRKQMNDCGGVLL